MGTFGHLCEFVLSSCAYFVVYGAEMQSYDGVDVLYVHGGGNMPISSTDELGVAGRRSRDTEEEMEHHV